MNPTDGVKSPNRHPLVFGPRVAMTASCIVHVGAIVLAAAFVALFRPSLADPPLPRAIEFAFLPPDISDAVASPRQAAAAVVDRQKTSRPSAVTLDAEPDTEQLQTTPAPEFTPGESSAPEQRPSQNSTSGRSRVEASPSPHYLETSARNASIRSTRHYSTIREHSRFVEPTTGPDMRLTPPRLAIPGEEHQVLLKKLEKVVERLTPPLLADSTFYLKGKDRRYTVKIEHERATDPGDLDEAVMEVTTQADGQELKTRLKLRRLAFSQFAQFVDYWDPNVLVHDDEFDGRFHTNNAFAISGSGKKHPRFRGKVTTAGYQVREGAGLVFLDRDSIFQETLETGIPAIRFPRSLRSLLEGERADSTVLRLTGEAWVQFHGDGAVTVRGGGRAEPERVAFAEDVPFTIVGEEKQAIHVRGTVRGQVLLYNRGHIIIEGDVRYAAPPDIFAASDDYLGLVSERDIRIGHPDRTGGGDLVIYAAMFARGRFKVTHRALREEARLHIYGSLTAGSLSATEPRYATRIRFDKRLEEKRPPHFPHTSRYEVKAWDAQWHLVPNPE